MSHELFKDALRGGIRLVDPATGESIPAVTTDLDLGFMCVLCGYRYDGQSIDDFDAAWELHLAECPERQ